MKHTHKYLETDFWMVCLSHEQNYFGRSFVELKRACGSLSELTTDEHLDFLAVVKKLESTFKNNFSATMFNWSCLMNHAYKNGHNPQVHWHFRPRYKTPVTFNGVIFEDPNFGHHNLRGKEHEKIVSEDYLILITDKLTELI